QLPQQRNTAAADRPALLFGPSSILNSRPSSSFIITIQQQQHQPVRLSSFPVSRVHTTSALHLLYLRLFFVTLDPYFIRNLLSSLVDIH
ncbi:hypothetical protein FJTKL_07376, partial [Diaporthe vaccinii]